MFNLIRNILGVCKFDGSWSLNPTDGIQYWFVHQYERIFVVELTGRLGVFDKNNGGGFLDEIYPTA